MITSSTWQMIKKTKESREHLHGLPVITWYGGEHNPDLLMPCLWDHAASLNKIKWSSAVKKEWLCSDTSLSEISSGPPLNDTVLLLGSLGTLLDSLNNWRRKCPSFGFNLYTKCCRTHSRSAPPGEKNNHSPHSLQGKSSMCYIHPICNWKNPLFFSLRWQCLQFICDFLRLTCLPWDACVSHYPSPSFSTPFWLGNVFLILWIRDCVSTLPALQEIQLLLIIKKDLVISIGKEFRTSAVFHNRDVKMWELSSSGH